MKIKINGVSVEVEEGDSIMIENHPLGEASCEVTIMRRAEVVKAWEIG